MDRLIQKASWKKAVLFTALFAAFYILINYSAVGVTGLLQITDGANILDFEFGYTAEKAHGMLAALGDTGRAFYLARILPIDFLFPVSYMLCYTGWIALLLKHINPKKIVKYLLIVPLLAMLCDWAENIGVIAMLRSWPILPPWAAALASVAGMVKFICTIFSIAIMAVLLVVWLVGRRRNA